MSVGAHDGSNGVRLIEAADADVRRRKSILRRIWGVNVDTPTKGAIY